MARLMQDLGISQNGETEIEGASSQQGRGAEAGFPSATAAGCPTSSSFLAGTSPSFPSSSATNAVNAGVSTLLGSDHVDLVLQRLLQSGLSTKEAARCGTDFVTRWEI